MFDGPCEAATSRDKSRIDSAIQTLEKTLGTIRENVGVLSNSLEPVMATVDQPPPNMNQSTPCDQPHGSRIALLLEELSGKAGLVNADISHIRQRLEI